MPWTVPHVTEAGEARRLLQVWFGVEADDAEAAHQQRALWWQKNPATDRWLAVQFPDWPLREAAGDFSDWPDTAHSRLARILICDQLPRNFYRDTPQAFASDERARHHCRRLLDAGQDRSLRAIERVFAYLPLEHSESLADQDESVRRYGLLVEDVPAAWQPVFSGFLDYAQRHREVIARFGRFPHRNPILGRVSTDEEGAYLAQPGSGF
jgi:uncharacterized protein (DUF924 family)